MEERRVKKRNFCVATKLTPINRHKPPIFILSNDILNSNCYVANQPNKIKMIRYKMSNSSRIGKRKFDWR